MSNVLIVYASTEGQTRKIAEYMAERVRESGWSADAVELGTDPDPGAYDAVIVGASIHMGQHPEALAAYCAAHRKALQTRPCAFFSVSLSAAGDETERADARRCLNEFLEEADWHPSLAEIVAGALRYRDYGWLKRWLMRRLMKKAGHETDTSRNHEYTDWDQVAEIARKVTESV